MKNILTILALLTAGEIIPVGAQITDALKIKIAKGTYSDETIIRFVNGATKNFDGSYDAWKLFSFNTSVPNIFTKDIVRDELTINAFPALSAPYSVDVFLKIGTAGTYSITPIEEGAFASGVCITMRDNTTGVLYDMRAAPTFTVSIPVTAQTAPARFTVFFNLPGTFSYYSTASGNWSDANTWSIIGCGGAAASSVPGFSNNIVICAGTNVSIDGSVSCTDITINGTLTGNNSINVSGDWINNGTFTAGTQTVIFSGSLTQAVSGSAANTFYNLNVNNSASAIGVVLYSPISVNGTIALQDGHLVTSASNILTCGASASISLLCTPQDSSFVKGPMNYIVNVSTGITKIFPVGKGNSYRRIDLTVDQQTTTSRTYTAEMIDNSADALGYTLPVSLSNVSYVRYHTITQSPAAAVDMAQVRMYFSCAGTDDQVKSLPPISVAKDNGSGAWTDLNDVPYGYSCSSSYWGNDLSGTFTSFTGTKFALGNTGAPVILPVTLTDFNARTEGVSVKTSWQTASESNSDYFEIERSLNGTDFETIGRTEAAGNSSSLKNYSFYDTEPLSGISFYRLKQTDKDGGFFYSSIAQVNFNSQNEISIYPNPVSEILNINISGSNDVETQISMIDFQGKVCFSKTITPGSDFENVSVNLESLRHGIYTVIVSANHKSYSKKIVIK